MAKPNQKKTPAEAPAKTYLYPVLGNIEHDGEPYVPGDEIELTEAQAASLSGLIGKAKGQEAGDQAPA